ncbi:MAG TPA: ATP-binding protein, partial [Nocardioides sp.]|nr:ATP-binding protein [Nocardioides sp.]
ALLAAQEGAAADALATLHQLASGIYPMGLEEAGVATALREALRDGVTVVDRGSVRYPIDVEAAAYFCALEAVQNATKHAAASTIRVEVDAGPEELILVVTDDGVGFETALVADGTGLANMRDRIDSAGGALEVASEPGRGTRLRVEIPAPVPASASVAAERG